MHHFFFQQLENYDVDFIVRLQNLDFCKYNFQTSWDNFE